MLVYYTVVLVYCLITLYNCYYIIMLVDYII